MAKESGSNRSSSWEGDPYTQNGVRLEYSQLSEVRKELIQSLSKRIGDEMWGNLKDKSVNQIADGKQIKIEFDRKGIRHVARDAMLTLSGKYMSMTSMINIHHILSNSEYIPSSHALSHKRKDNRNMWFKYKDSHGRGIYFSISYDSSRQKKYTLYSVTDISPYKREKTK